MPSIVCWRGKQESLQFKDSIQSMTPKSCMFRWCCRPLCNRLTHHAKLKQHGKLIISGLNLITIASLYRINWWMISQRQCLKWVFLVPDYRYHGKYRCLPNFDGTFVFGLRNSCIMNAPRSQMRPDQKVSRAEEMILDCFLINGLIVSLGQRHRHQAAANSGFRHHTPLHAELQAVIPVRRIEGKYSLEGKLQRKDAQSWRALADSVDSVRLTSGLQIPQEDTRGEERKDEQREAAQP